MKLAKIIAALAACAALFGCAKKDSSSKTVKIGIAKIVQHPALDAVEKGVMDVVNENGFSAQYDLQNANGDVNTAAQIALKYKDERVNVAVGIATPVALALATSIKDIPIVFGTVTDPVGAGLVSSINKGENNVCGMSDAIPSEQHIALFKKVAGLKLWATSTLQTKPTQSAPWSKSRGAAKKPAWNWSLKRLQIPAKSRPPQRRLSTALTEFI